MSTVSLLQGVKSHIESESIPKSIVDFSSYLHLQEVFLNMKSLQIDHDLFFKGKVSFQIEESLSIHKILSASKGLVLNAKLISNQGSIQSESILSLQTSFLENTKGSILVANDAEITTYGNCYNKQSLIEIGGQLILKKGHWNNSQSRIFTRENISGDILSFLVEKSTLESSHGSIEIITPQDCFNESDEFQNSDGSIWIKQGSLWTAKKSIILESTHAEIVGSILVVQEGDLCLTSTDHLSIYSSEISAKLSQTIQSNSLELVETNFRSESDDLIFSAGSEGIGFEDVHLVTSGLLNISSDRDLSIQSGAIKANMTTLNAESIFVEGSNILAKSLFQQKANTIQTKNSSVTSEFFKVKASLYQTESLKAHATSIAFKTKQSLQLKKNLLNAIEKIKLSSIKSFVDLSESTVVVKKLDIHSYRHLKVLQSSLKMDTDLSLTSEKAWIDLRKSGIIAQNIQILAENESVYFELNQTASNCSIFVKAVFCEIEDSKLTAVEGLTLVGRRIHAVKSSLASLKRDVTLDSEKSLKLTSTDHTAEKGTFKAGSKGLISEKQTKTKTLSINRKARDLYLLSIADDVQRIVMDAIKKIVLIDYTSVNSDEFKSFANRIILLSSNIAAKKAIFSSDELLLSDTEITAEKLESDVNYLNLVDAILNVSLLSFNATHAANIFDTVLDTDVINTLSEKIKVINSSLTGNASITSLDTLSIIGSNFHKSKVSLSSDRTVSIKESYFDEDIADVVIESTNGTIDIQSSVIQSDSLLTRSETLFISDSEIEVENDLNLKGFSTRINKSDVESKAKASLVFKEFLAQDLGLEAKSVKLLTSRLEMLASFIQTEKKFKVKSDIISLQESTLESTAEAISFYSEYTFIHSTIIKADTDLKLKGIRVHVEDSELFADKVKLTSDELLALIDTKTTGIDVVQKSVTITSEDSSIESTTLQRESKHLSLLNEEDNIAESIEEKAGKYKIFDSSLKTKQLKQHFKKAYLFDNEFVVEKQATIESKTIDGSNNTIIADDQLEIKAKSIDLPDNHFASVDILLSTEENLQISSAYLEGIAHLTAGSSISLKDAEVKGDLKAKAKKTIDADDLVVEESGLLSLKAEDLYLARTDVTTEIVDLNIKELADLSKSSIEAEGSVEIRAKKLAGSGVKVAALSDLKIDVKEHAHLEHLKAEAFSLLAKATTVNINHSEVTSDSLLKVSTIAAIEGASSYLESENDNVELDSGTIIDVKSTTMVAKETVLLDAKRAIHHEYASTTATTIDVKTPVILSKSAKFDGDIESKTEVFDARNTQFTINAESSIDSHSFMTSNHTEIKGTGVLSIDVAGPHVHEGTVKTGGFTLEADQISIQKEVDVKNLDLHARKSIVEIAKKARARATETSIIDCVQLVDAGSLQTKDLTLTQENFAYPENTRATGTLTLVTPEEIILDKKRKIEGSLALVSDEDVKLTEPLFVTGNFSADGKLIKLAAKVETTGKGVFKSKSDVVVDHTTVSFGKGIDVTAQNAFRLHSSNLNVVETSSVEAKTFSLRSVTKKSQHIASIFSLKGDLKLKISDFIENDASHFLVDGDIDMSESRVKSITNKNKVHLQRHKTKIGTYKVKRFLRKSKKKTLYTTHHQIVVDGLATTQISGNLKINAGSVDNDGLFLCGSIEGKIENLSNGIFNKKAKANKRILKTPSTKKMLNTSSKSLKAQRASQKSRFRKKKTEDRTSIEEINSLLDVFLKAQGRSPVGINSKTPLLQVFKKLNLSGEGDFHALKDMHLKISNLKNTGVVAAEESMDTQIDVLLNCPRGVEEKAQVLRVKTFGRIRKSKRPVDQVQSGGIIKAAHLKMHVKNGINAGTILGTKSEDITGSILILPEIQLRKVVHLKTGRIAPWKTAKLHSTKKTYLTPKIASLGKQKITLKVLKNLGGGVIFSGEKASLRINKYTQRTPASSYTSYIKRGSKVNKDLKSIHMQEGGVRNVNGGLDFQVGELDSEGGSIGSLNDKTRLHVKKKAKFRGKTLSADNRVSSVGISGIGVSTQTTHYNTTKTSLPTLFAGDGLELKLGENATLDAEGLQIHVKSGDIEVDLPKGAKISIRGHQVKRYQKTEGVSASLSFFGSDALTKALKGNSSVNVIRSIISEDPALASLLGVMDSRDLVSCLSAFVRAGITVWSEFAKFAESYNAGKLGEAVGNHFGITDKDGKFAPKITLSVGSFKQKTTWTETLPPTIFSPGNLRVRGGKQTYKGLQTNIKGDATFTGEEIGFISEVDTHKQSSSNGALSIGFGPDGIDAGVTFSQSQSGSTRHLATHVNVGGTLKVEAKKVDVLQSTLEADHVDVQAEILKVKSLKDTSYQKSTSVSASTTGSVSLSVESSSKETLKTAASIKARKSGTIKAKKSVLDGAVIDNCKTEINDLTRSSIETSKKSTSINVKTNVSDIYKLIAGEEKDKKGIKTLAQVDIAKESTTVTTAPTIAHVSGKSYEGVNRDLSKVQAHTKSKKTRVSAPIVVIDENALQQEFDQIKKAVSKKTETPITQPTYIATLSLVEDEVKETLGETADDEIEEIDTKKLKKSEDVSEEEREVKSIKTTKSSKSIVSSKNVEDELIDDDYAAVELIAHANNAKALALISKALNIPTELIGLAVVEMAKELYRKGEKTLKVTKELAGILVKTTKFFEGFLSRLEISFDTKQSLTRGVRSSIGITKAIDTAIGNLQSGYKDLPSVLLKEVESFLSPIVKKYDRFVKKETERNERLCSLYLRKDYAKHLASDLTHDSIEAVQGTLGVLALGTVLKSAKVAKKLASHARFQGKRPLLSRVSKSTVSKSTTQNQSKLSSKGAHGGSSSYQKFSTLFERKVVMQKQTNLIQGVESEKAFPIVSVSESSWDKTTFFSIKKVDDNLSVAFVNKIASKQHLGMHTLAGTTLKRLKKIAKDQGSNTLHFQFAIQNEKVFKLCQNHFNYLGLKQHPFTEYENLFHTFEIPLYKILKDENNSLNVIKKLFKKESFMKFLKADGGYIKLPIQSPGYKAVKRRITSNSHLKTFDAFYSHDKIKGIDRRDLMSLLSHLCDKITEKGGRIKIFVKGKSLTFHNIHQKKEVDAAQIKQIRKFLESAFLSTLTIKLLKDDSGALNLNAVISFFKKLDTLISTSAMAQPLEQAKKSSSPTQIADKAALRKRPVFSEALKAYEKVISIPELVEIVGGKLKQNFDGNSFINGCASRISYVLGQLGYKIPIIPGQTVSGADGKQYIYRLSTLEPFLIKTFGPPDYEWPKDSTSERSFEEIKNNLKGKKGIIIERWKPNTLITSCTGHAYLFDGKDVPIALEGRRILFWELPDDNKN